MIINTEMIGLLSLECFQQNAKVIGNENQLSLKLILQLIPFGDTLCEAASGTNSSILIKYGSQNYSKTFIFDANDVIEIEFDLSDDKPVFDQIFKNMIISYEVLLAGSLSTMGPVQKINLIKLDISDCWRNVKLTYQIVIGKRFISMIGVPRRCDIKKPQVQFEYNVDNVWNILNVQGSSDGAGYFNENNTYDYSAITNYKQPETADNKDIFDDFFETFMDHRNIPVRFVFKNVDFTIVNNIQIIQNENIQCLQSLSPVGFLTKNYIDVGVDNYKFETLPSCVSGAVVFKANIVLQIQNKSLTTTTIKQDASIFLARFGIEFEFLTAIEDFKNVNEGTFQVYFTTFDEDDNIILDTSFSGLSVISCIDYFNVKLNPSQACISINFYDSQRCLNLPKATFDMSFTSQLNGLTSRMTFFNYEIQVVPSSKIQVVCSSTLTDKILGMNSTLPMSKRYKVFADYIKQRKNIYTPLTSNTELINWSTVNLDIQIQQLLAYLGICTLVLISVITIVIISVRESQ